MTTQKLERESETAYIQGGYLWNKANNLEKISEKIGSVSVSSLLVFSGITFWLVQCGLLFWLNDVILAVFPQGTVEPGFEAKRVERITDQIVNHRNVIHSPQPYQKTTVFLFPFYIIYWTTRKMIITFVKLCFTHKH